MRTNESSSVGPSVVCSCTTTQRNLGFSIESPVDWNIIEETNFASFSLYTDPWTTRHNTNSKFRPQRPEVVASDKDQYQNFRIIYDSSDVSLGGYVAYTSL
ncbi:MAG: hypothetical protein ACR2IS_08550 [Nitrososphaeraceae archaeon]